MPEGFSDMNPETRLEAWLDDAFFRVMMWEDFGLREDDGVRLDYSGRSLRGLAQFVRGYYNSPDEISLDEPDPGEEIVSVSGIALYLGDTLERLADGAWEWDVNADPERFPEGLPIVRPNAVLGLDPVSPVLMMRDVVRSGDEEVFTALFQEWKRAVELIRRTQPLWPAPDSLIAWLTQRSEAFASWVATYASEGTWDFSPESLPGLEELVRSLVPVKTELKLPVNNELREGAAWYFGEVMRRGIGGRWSQEVDSISFVEVGPRNITFKPVVALRVSIVQPGYLRSYYDQVAS